MTAEERLRQTGDLLLTFTSTHDGSPQPYRLHVPEVARRGDPLPLLVVLHGKGVDHDAWFTHTPVQRHAEERGYLVAAPYARGDSFYRGPGERDVLDVIDRVKQRWPIDPDRVYLVGHSMGGWGAWWIGLRHPDLFASICPMAGMAPIELLQNAEHLSPLIIHDEGDPVVPVRHSRQPAAELQRLGVRFHYREETGYGHASRLIGDHLARIFDWFQQHRRVQHPPHVSFVTRTPACGQAYWLRVLDTADFPKPAHVDARVQTPDRVRLRTADLRAIALDLAEMPTDPRRPCRVSIDRQTFEVPNHTGWAVFTASPETGSWDCAHRDAKTPPDPCRGSVPDVAAPWRTAGGDSWQAAAVAGILLRQTDADLCLLHDDMFLWPQTGPDGLPADALLDVSLYCEDRLGRVRCDGQRLRQVLSLESSHLQIYPPGSAIDARRTHRVIAPLHVAHQFADPEELPRTIGEYLYKAARA